MRRPGGRDADRAGDISGAIEKIGRWRASSDADDDMFRSAVLRELGIIGEAVAALSDGFKADRADIPWRSIAGLRNVLVHEYWDTAWTLVETVLDEDLAHLRSAVARAAQQTQPTARRPAPIAQPSGQAANAVCGKWMPISRMTCVLRPEHAGGCRSR